MTLTPTAKKNEALIRLADLIDSATDSQLAANAEEVKVTSANGLGAAQIGRLTLTPAT